ncbi:MAG: NAD-dependent epimerase/dehydratase family protein [Chloroflexi bacterium]|nr:GDP-mannose 4,6-dehydratase [Chloroflexota bacterium]MQC26039.1 NAD-dependent epimerase/dehydratase family protein [Chloroflexota bacterium]
MADYYVVTGGAGFIGSNYVDHLLTQGRQVTIFDNLSRRGADRNLAWLRQSHGADSFNLVVGDLRDPDSIKDATSDADVIVHLAAQVAVTTSVLDPRTDFEINALGTLNLLEAARASDRHPFIIYSSTNKVYGEMEDHPVVERAKRYEYAKLPHGVPETQQLDFHSPYGCSKGAAEQYVHDYARIYDIPSVVMRQSCIYGQRQFGVEDQGWLAWFVIAAVLEHPITIFGDGKQVRDMLDVRDLVRAYDSAVENRAAVAGQVFNIGGGPKHTLSIWLECGPMLEQLLGRKIPVSWMEPRPGDQKVYISDIRKAKRELAWTPQVPINDGVEHLVNWVRANHNLFA